MLELISLNKKYVTKAGDTQALSDVSLRFPETGLVFITGKSGSGKTTLLNIIGGLDGFDSGEIRLNGKSFSNFSSADFDSYRNTFVGFIFQEYNLLPEYTVGKNIDIALELQGEKGNSEKTKELLESVEISGLGDRKPNQLSGGQKQRVAIVRALIKNPKIILADELTGALDSVTGQQVIEILKKLSKEKLVIVVSHDLELAEKYADRIIKISDGKVVEDVTLKDVELQGNLHQTSGNLTVKTPSELTKEENEILLDAIKANKKITFTDKISVREKAETKEPAQRQDEQAVKLINSKMKFASAVSLGFKSLWTKPVRLIVTVLLSVIAFAVFGLFDAIASYDDGKVITSLLREGTYSSLPVYATYSDEYYDQTKIKLSQPQIDELSDDTGYSFRGVYDILDTDIVRYKGSSREGYNATAEIIGLSSNSSNPMGWAYYTKKVNGIVTFDESEIEFEKIEDDNTEKDGYYVVDPEGFNYEVLYGEYPEYYKGIEDLQIAISSYVAESICFWAKPNNCYFNGKYVRNVEDLVGVELQVNDNVFVITAIIDCGELPEKFEKLKMKDEKSLSYDFETYLNSGCYLNLFAPSGLVAYLRSENSRTVNYYSDFKNNLSNVSVNDVVSDFSGKYYSVSNVSKDNYLFFDSSKTQLNDDECLINIADVGKEYFNQELNSPFAKDDYASIRANISSLTSTTDSNQRVLYFNKLLASMKIIQDNDPNIETNFTKTLSVTTREKNGSNLLNESFVKVVGIYWGIDTDAPNSVSDRFEPLMVTEQGLELLKITPNQGIYSRAIAPMYRNRSGERVIGNKMNQSEGINLNWFGNSVLETVAEERELISQLLNLVLYLAIVLALFSVFMLFNYISLSINSKRQTIGILRTLGANKKNIFIMFITEALLISIINGIFACVFAYLGCILINTYLVEVMNLTLNIAMFDYRQVLVIFMGSIITGILSSLAPIIKISKKKPVELIRTL